jgi:phosphoribosylformylglycinamidine cyclo-ligase
MLPAGVQARLLRSSWTRPPIFSWLQRHGTVADDEMHRVFNCGIGLVIAVAAADVQRTIDALNASGERAYDIGEIVARPDGAPHALVA